MEAEIVRLEQKIKQIQIDIEEGKENTKQSIAEYQKRYAEITKDVANFEVVKNELRLDTFYF